jgi:hypothetical protein
MATLRALDSVLERLFITLKEKQIEAILKFVSGNDVLCDYRLAMVNL